MVGLSILSGSHVDLVRDVAAKMQDAGIGHIPLVVGGIIPPEDELVLKQVGVSRVYTPDYKLNEIMSDVVSFKKAPANWSDRIKSKHLKEGRRHAGLFVSCSPIKSLLIATSFRKRWRGRVEREFHRALFQT